MAGFLRKLFGHQHNSQSTDKDTDLEKFYTDSEYAIEIFQHLVSEANLPKRLLVIHGIGGVGKSTLLKMYSLACHKQHIPSAVAASEETPSPVDVLANWVDDLSYEGVTLPTVQKTLNHYRAIQAKVEAEAKEASQTKSQIAGTFSKLAAKTAIGMAASAIPIFGPIVSILGGESAEAFVDWLRGFLSKPDIEFYLDPAKRLDNDFLKDVGQVATHQRIALMVDTYEQMTILDDWMRELAQHLPKNVLLVIASRTVPEWNRAWQEWMGKTEIVELKEMSSEDLHTLVHRYYSYLRSGKPPLKQVEAIVQFARGLPMVATTVVQLWVKYGAEDFQSVRPQVVADLADRLFEGVPQEMLPAFEAAAVLRYFNVDALAALLEESNVEGLYAELRRWPFIRSRREGLAVHDTMREMINEALRLRTPKRFRILQERAADYYEAQLAKATGDERERYTLERLYHSIRANEGSGAQLFQEIAEELTRYRLVNQLRTLLNDVNTYPLELENSRLWKEYYNARLAHLEARINQALEIYQMIGEDDQIEPKLRAYTLCDWGEILCRREYLRQPGVEEKAIQLLELSLRLRGSPDLKLAMSWVYLSDIFRARGNWEKALHYLDQSRKFFTERKDNSGLLAVLDYERGIYERQGNLRKLFDVEKEMSNSYIIAGKPLYLRTRISTTWDSIWAGRYAETEKDYRVTIQAAKSLQDQEYLAMKTRDLALCLSFQGKCSEALTTAEAGLTLATSLGEMEIFGALHLYGIVCFKCEKLERAVELLLQSITVGQKIHTHLVAALLYLAITYEVLNKFDKAEQYHKRTQVEAHEADRSYFECGATTGLIRTKYTLRNYAAIAPLLAEAERIAQRYEYNDHLTSIYLTRGHSSWDNPFPEWQSDYDSALPYYQHALVYALRYNRFLLDEALLGREHGTPLKPIIPHCLGRGKEGRQMLIALRDWWQMGINDVGKPRPDTISPIPEGISLLEAERIAREREPGDGLPQEDVVEQINSALS